MSMIGAILVLLLLFQADTPAFPSVSGESGGIWLLSEGVWLPLPSAPVTEAKTKGFDNYIYTGGYTNLNMDISFAGSRAAIRVINRNPVFMVERQENDGYDPVLIRLEKKKDRRICRTRPSSASAGNIQGFRRKDIIRTILTVNPDKSFTVRPDQPLKPGEYLLVTGTLTDGRDFGVD